MLLDHRRILEGAWALYSLAWHATHPIRPVVHNDGSLTAADEALLTRLLPGTTFVPRAEADAHVTGELRRRGLARCEQLRTEFILALKLFDPLFLATKPYVLMDSDVLFYSPPTELLDPAARFRASRSGMVYSPDYFESALPGFAEYVRDRGATLAAHVNTGLCVIDPTRLTIDEFERALAAVNVHTGPEGRVNHDTEQTLLAIAFGLTGAAPLPDTYSMCGNPYERPLRYGHYCGGGIYATQFYTHGLPWLFERIAAASGGERRGQ